MALSPCNTTVDQTNRELVEHGTSIFPFACYHDDLSKGEVPWHWHDEWEAVVVSEGVCTIAAGKEKYLIHQGEGFFCPKESHGFNPSAHSDSSRRSFLLMFAISTLRFSPL